MFAGCTASPLPDGLLEDPARPHVACPTAQACLWACEPGRPKWCQVTFCLVHGVTGQAARLLPCLPQALEGCAPHTSWQDNCAHHGGRASDQDWVGTGDAAIVHVCDGDAVIVHVCDGDAAIVHVSDAAIVHVGDAAIVHVCDGDAAIVRDSNAAIVRSQQRWSNCTGLRRRRSNRTRLRRRRSDRTRQRRSDRTRLRNSWQSDSFFLLPHSQRQTAHLRTSMRGPSDASVAPVAPPPPIVPTGSLRIENAGVFFRHRPQRPRPRGYS